ncbi:MAG TPA: bifunctional phosphopantothenoylcysteine decarboxylase/phosphopantothenate--cysteine ligase CoaBC [Actinomycetota bacterium]|nr:bifunctional phosphopantothenoylcysteine decarboxylase/phosphopantothenate--cysteine ligase CoaBC [Actinomycetota bacterium]
MRASPLAGRRLLLCVSGGIAAYKAVHLARLLVQAGAEVRVALTEAAARFVGPDTFAALTGRPAHTSVFEEPGSVLHVRLAREADLAIVAPATAHAIARLALGLADDLVTSALLEATCPLVAAPAMHTGMWEHPATAEHVRALAARGARIVGPAAGPLAAGDEGMGRMAEPEEILAAAEDVLARDRALAGRRILVTAGPTFEPVDAVRFLGNRSSGRMGVEVAREAWARGAAVTLVLGPGTVEPPPGVEVVRVTTAQEMRDAVAARFDDADAVVMAAAVADFRPDRPLPGKRRKEEGPPELRLVPTPDILRELGERKGDRILVGFAAETEDVEASGRAKLERKHLDLVVANEVGREGTGFGSETNRAAILSRAGDDLPLRTWTKRELAAELCDRLAKLLPS